VRLANRRRARAAFGRRAHQRRGYEH
jgi:hypothetical protein